MLECRATEDGLTKRANRRRFDSCLEQEFARAKRAGATLALVLIDVDHFKAFNDRYGHPAGDACLRSVACVLQEAVKRPTDLAARYGGEELAVLLPGTDTEGAMIVAETVRQAIAERAIEHAGAQRGFVTVGAGAASIVPAGTIELHDLVERADKALYQAKAAGRNRALAAASDADAPSGRAAA